MIDDSHSRADAVSANEETEAAFRQAAARVLERARQTQTPVIVFRDGEIQSLPPDAFDLPSLQPGKRPADG